MRIAIIAPGSRGDVQPYIALGTGLQNAGHLVRFITHRDFEKLVKPHGLEFWAVDSSVQDIVENHAMRERIERGSFLLLLVQMAREAQIAAVHLAETALAACQEVDLLIAGMGGVYTAIAVAEKLHLPLLQAFLVPFSPTRSFPGVIASALPAWSGWLLNLPTQHLTRQLLWQGFRSADSLTRRQVLGLPPAPFWGPYHSESVCAMPILYGFSPSVIPAPPDWVEHIHITGYWFLDSQDSWIPPADLLNFLDSGPAPVYIGFGSMSSRNPRQTADLVIQALEQSRQRAVLLSGWGGLQSSSLPENCFMIDSVPHDWLFPRMAAVVHHGGAGTTAAGLRAGVPSIIIPFFGDQPFWGRLVAVRGIGPQPIPRRHLSAQRLALALQQAVSSAEMRRSAAELGQKIHAEDGLARAVEIIERLHTCRP